MTAAGFDRIKKAFIEELTGGLAVQEPMMAMAEMPAADAIQARQSLGELVDSARNSLTLGAYIRGKAHRRDMVTYRPALFDQGQISRDYWSRLLNDEVNASKEKLLRVAVLLQLSADEAEQMLGHAGYSLSSTIPRDVVVEYCLRQKHYDFALIEQLLSDHEIQSLFNDRRGA